MMRGKERKEKGEERGAEEKRKRKLKRGECSARREENE